MVERTFLGMVIDAATIAGLTFFTSVPAAALIGTPDALRLGVLLAFFNAGGMFFLQLAIARHLRPPLGPSAPSGPDGGGGS